MSHFFITEPVSIIYASIKDLIALTSTISGIIVDCSDIVTMILIFLSILTTILLLGFVCIILLILWIALFYQEFIIPIKDLLIEKINKSEELKNNTKDDVEEEETKNEISIEIPIDASV